MAANCRKCSQLLFAAWWDRETGSYKCLICGTCNYAVVSNPKSIRHMESPPITLRTTNRSAHVFVGNGELDIHTLSKGSATVLRQVRELRKKLAMRAEAEAAEDLAAEAT